MLLEQSVSTLAYHLQDVFRDGKTIAQWLQNLRQAYEAITIENKLVDGVVPYPQTKDSGEKEAIDGDTGVKIEFKYVAALYSTLLASLANTEYLRFCRDVTFSYPDAPRPALQNMSFKIEPGQLCVIVGENGSKCASIPQVLRA